MEWALSPFPEGAFEYIEDLAWRGDARAQLLLGTTYVDGKLVPRDLVLGYAWLLVAADRGPWQYLGEGSPGKAREVSNELIAALDGRQLIEADQIAAKIRAELTREWQDGVQRAVLRLTGQTPFSISPLVLSQSTVRIIPQAPAREEEAILVGCAALPSMKGCALPADFAAQPHCTGVLPVVNVLPSMVGEQAVTRRPQYPVSALHNGAEGNVGLIMHVDHTGWVCSVTVFRSSGVPDIDRSALEGTRFWRAVPASRAGQPVESLFVLGVTFSVYRYSFRDWN